MFSRLIHVVVCIKHSIPFWGQIIFHGIKIGGRNINNLRYVDDTALLAKSEEELKNLLMRLKEESDRAGLELNIKKN